MLVRDNKEFTKMTELKVENKFYARGGKARFYNSSAEQKILPTKQSRALFELGGL